MASEVIVPEIISVLSIIGSAFAVFRAEKAAKDQARLQQRLDAGLVKTTAICNQEVAALLEISACLSDTQRQVRGIPLQRTPPLEGMPDGRLAEFLDAKQIKEEVKRPIMEASGVERVAIYGKYLSRQALNTAWASLYSTRSLIESKAPLLPEDLASALIDHVGLLSNILSDYELYLFGGFPESALQDRRDNLGKLEPSYKEAVTTLRAELHRQPDEQK